jgi:hypothetical protein
MLIFYLLLLYKNNGLLKLMTVLLSLLLKYRGGEGNPRGKK